MSISEIKFYQTLQITQCIVISFITRVQYEERKADKNVLCHNI